VLAGGDGERLLVGLLSELRRAGIGYPDLPIIAVP